MSVLQSLVTPKLDSGKAGSAQIDVRAVETLTHPLARKFADFYFSRAAEGRPLARADIPSRGMYPFMAELCLLEPVDDGADWLLRLVGTGVCRRYGVDATGYRVSQLYPAGNAAEQIAGYKLTAQSRGFHVTRGRIKGTAKDFFEVEFCNAAIKPPQPGLRWIATGVFVLDT
jgi:hypothetical protein